MTPTSSLFKRARRYLTESRPQKQTVDPYIEAISRSIVVGGAGERDISYSGISQDDRDGTASGPSTCGLAALNFARIVFSMQQRGLEDITLLQAVLARSCAEETMAICTLWSGNCHLDVEDICRIPVFEKTLKIKTTTYGRTGVSEFNFLLTELDNLDSSAVVIITRPPETIACLKLRLVTRNVFIIFDSHPRPSYPNGVRMIVSPSIRGIARRLANLLPTVDLPDGFQFEAQLLPNYIEHIIVPNGVETTTPSLWQAILESSLAQLSIQGEIAELRSQNEFLKGEQERLESEIKEAEQKRRSSTPSSAKESTYTPNLISALNSFTSILLFLPSYLLRLLSALLALIPVPPARGQVALGHPSKPLPPTPPSDRDDSILEAMRLQNEFDEEDRALSAQRAELAKSARRLFKCGICMEEMLEDSVARPDPCGHTFCRECLRGHVTARLDEHRFPILCPTCTADKGKGKGKEEAGEVSQSLALDLGLTHEQYRIWIEMEMVSFSVVLCCRKCQRTMFVARDEHEEAKIIVCPLPDCNHVWCKQCQQSIDSKGPKHSCDGTSELDQLMKEQGWKYCPSCKTPIQRISGCNHMSCLTPACNTQFCYMCGGLIVKSALGPEIKEAVSAHYMKNCVLFEVPE